MTTGIWYRGFWIDCLHGAFFVEAFNKNFSTLEEAKKFIDNFYSR